MAIQGVASFCVWQYQPPDVSPSIQLPATASCVVDVNVFVYVYVDERVAVTGSSSTAGPVNAMHDRYLGRLVKINSQN